MAAILAVPALDACSGDGRGTLTCLRDLLDDRFRLSGEVTAERPAPTAPPAAEVVPGRPAVTEAPVSTATAAASATAPVGPVAEAAATIAVPAPSPLTVAGTARVPGGAMAAEADVALPALPDIALVGSAVTPANPASAAAHVSMPPPLRLAIAAEASVPFGAATGAATLAVPAPPPLAVSGEGAAVPSPAAAAAGRLVVPPPAPQLRASVAAPFTPNLATTTVTIPPLRPSPTGPTLAEAGPAEPPAPAAPEAAPVPPAAPTIDAIELDVGGSFVAGDGPAGALMRLYLDGEPVGESPVEGGRWLVDEVPLFGKPSQDLRVEAIEPATGRVLGEAAVTVEVELPPADAIPEDGTPTLQPAPPPAAPEPPPEPQSRSTTPPPLAPVSPSGQSDSITILARPSGATEMLPAPSATAQSSIVAIGPPAAVAGLALPAPPVALRILPFGELRFSTGSAIIRNGDTLWTLARRHYGHGIHFRTILNANREQIGRAARIYPGQVLELPLVTDGSYP